MLLVAVYLKMLTSTRGEVGHRLFWQVNLYLNRMVFVDTGKQLTEEIFRHYDRKHEVVKLIVLVDVSENELITTRKP